MNIFQAMGSFSAVVSIIFALIICFNGYNLFKFLVKFYGFVIFALLGFLLSQYFGFDGAFMYIIIICGGLVGVFLSFRFYKFSVFIAIAFQMYAVIYSIIPVGFVALILSCIVGSLAQMFIKPVIAISTASSSALVISSSAVALLPFLTPFDIVIFILFAVLGSCKQIL